MAVLTDKQMDKHIKERNFAKVYLIYGEEQMYVKKYTDKLVTAVAGKTPSEFNFHSFGDSINFDELAASVQIVPFMSEFNCVLVSDAAFDEFNANDNARFADIYKAVPDGCVFIFRWHEYSPFVQTCQVFISRFYVFHNTVKLRPAKVWQIFCQSAVFAVLRGAGLVLFLGVGRAVAALHLPVQQHTHQSAQRKGSRQRHHGLQILQQKGLGDLC